MKKFDVVLLCLWSALVPMLAMGFWNHFKGDWEVTLVLGAMLTGFTIFSRIF